jgi:hypothetical protein
MTTAIASIEIAARAEAHAEAGREHAEAAWRSAWWRTTHALGVPTARAEVSEAFDTAVALLGQSRSYLGVRRAVGIAFADLPEPVRNTLPPRLSMAWAEAHRGDKAGDEAAAVIMRADAEGVSLREFAARFGKRFETQPEPRQLTPAEVVEAVRNDPDAARALARHDDTRAIVEEAGIDVRAERRPELPEPIATPDARRDTAERVRQGVEQRIGHRTDEATNYLRGAVNDLGHALFARDRFGIEDIDAETDAVRAIEQLLHRYKAHATAGNATLTDEDRAFLDGLGINADD